MNSTRTALLVCLGLLALPACQRGHGPVADGVSGPMGAALPDATAEQLEVFFRGEALAQKRFSRADGLGPGFNVTFCGACHEKPTFGGSAGLYRSFSLAGRTTPDGAFLPAVSVGNASGVVRLYTYGDEVGGDHEPIDDANGVIGKRNPIPFFGVGLLAELDESEILRRADPDDRNGDGISGRPNYDRGFVGRFGVKAQTVSIEGFIRGPLNNHLGITTDPLSNAQKAALPVPSADLVAARGGDWATFVGHMAQVAAPDGPLTDGDAVADPEMSTDDLFDLVSWAMLLAAPEVEEPGEQELRGIAHFDRSQCGDCHTPRLEGPRGPLAVYSDLLLHDMGPELDDGHPFGEATSSEFRTQPLWGLTAVGPYLHDGRATTIEEAIAMHGGEAEASRDRWMQGTEQQRADGLAFLVSLGGRDQQSGGLLRPGEPVADVGDWGGPSRELTPGESSRFENGRRLFDHEFGFEEGVGGPRFNGDSCRACHFEPVFGGAGPRGVNVIRHGILNGDGAFVPPSVGTILHRETALLGQINRPQTQATHFEARQTPHLFGLGLIESIPASVIEGGADPEDADGDGISGRISRVDGGRLGRLGWKAQVPSIAEFVRDAVTAELGMTLPIQEGLTFGRVQDNDDVPDPEFARSDAEDLAFYLSTLAPPPRGPVGPDEQAGEALFSAVGCDLCHTPSLEGVQGPVPLYSDLLLHEVLPEGAPGIEDTSASMTEFRTPPLWGLRSTGPYLHTGAADTIEQAVSAHAGEASTARDAFLALDPADRAALLAFLESL